MSMPAAPGSAAPGQGSAGGTDIVTALQGVIRQLSTANKNMLTLISAIEAVNFPQNVKGYTVATLPSSPSIGQLAYVTDGTAGLAWGANLTGSHATTYLTWWNGAHWTVVGE
jgi:hypothetical protein